MLSVQSVIGCRLTFDKLLRAELRGGLRGRSGRVGGGAMRAVGQVTVGRGGLMAMMLQNLRCRLNAGQVTKGWGGLQAMMWQYAVRADCGPSYCGAG